MTEDIKKASRYTTIGVNSDYDPKWGLRQDEFIADLRGERGIRRLREMSENDPICGAILSAMDLMVRSTPWRVEDGSEKARELVDYSLNHLEDVTFEMFLSDVLSFLPYGFSLFEIVARRPNENRNGWVTLKALAPRAQWTVDRFDTDRTGKILGVYQQAATGSAYIPYSKLLHFRTASKQNDPAGMSVLRTAYTSWYYKNRIQEIEAVAIERELNGLPLFRIPAEYLSDDATPAQKAFATKISQIGRDVKRNEMGHVVLPSDLYEDADGKLTNQRMVEFELIASKGTRDIKTGEVIIRYQQDMARSALADFVLLGTNDRGSFALSKSKADLFLKALEGYLDAIASVLNRKLVPKLLAWNGIDMADAPKIVHGRVAPVDLKEFGDYIARMAGVGIRLTDEASEAYIRTAAGLPPSSGDPDPTAPTSPTGDVRGRSADEQPADTGTNGAE